MRQNLFPRGNGAHLFWWVGIVVATSSCRCVTAVVFSGAGRPSVTSLQTREYCVYERFTARCDADHVIIIRSALYGRMRARRCITSDYANALGCYSDVTEHVDGLCSGRQNCSLLVATMDSVAQPCAKDFKSYLEAAYDCVPGKSCHRENAMII